MRAPRIAAVPALVLTASGCVSGNWAQVWVQEEPEAAAYEALEPGKSTLDDCLDALGAPLIVQELGEGAWAAWGWSHELDWGAQVSVPVSDFYSASLSYGDLAERLHGIVVLYDAGWHVVEVRRGYLNELVRFERRPQLVELLDQPQPKKAAGEDP